MSQNQYSGYGGNPYSAGEQTANPYASGGGGASGYGQANPYSSEGYGQTQQQAPQSALSPPNVRHEASNYSQATQGSQYSTTQQSGGGGHTQPQQTHAGAYGQLGARGTDGSAMRQPTAPLGQEEFLQRIQAIKGDINELPHHVQGIATAHQRALTSTETAGTTDVIEAMVTETQILNTKIRDQIKFLESDAARDPSSSYKKDQVGTQKRSFKTQLQGFQKEETDYRERYRQQIERQYRIVNPQATDDEVREASQADWGNEGVFQTALKSNRTATATSTLGAVRARHNDIQKIEQTLMQLNQLFTDLAAEVEVQEPLVQQTEQHAENVHKDTAAANTHLEKGIKSSKNRRKLKWWCLAIAVLIVVIIGLVLGLYFGLQGKKNNR